MVQSKLKKGQFIGKQTNLYESDPYEIVSIHVIDINYVVKVNSFCIILRFVNYSIINNRLSNIKIRLYLNQQITISLLITIQSFIIITIRSIIFL